MAELAVIVVLIVFASIVAGGWACYKAVRAYISHRSRWRVVIKTGRSDRVLVRVEKKADAYDHGVTVGSIAPGSSTFEAEMDELMARATMTCAQMNVQQSLNRQLDKEG